MHSTWVRVRAHLRRSLPPHKASRAEEELAAPVPAGHAPAGLPQHRDLDIRDALNGAAMVVEVVAPPAALGRRPPPRIVSSRMLATLVVVRATNGPEAQPIPETKRIEN